jgi:formylglycine-generating enzyme required for sulfatase activity
LYRGRCFDKLGRYKEAIDDYSQVIETSPKLAEASLCRGNTHVRAGRFREGLADQKRAIRLGGIREGDLIHRDAENGALFRFVFVPPGHYLVGFSKEQRVSSAIQSRQLLFGHNATPVTEVDLRKGFFILDREVTKLQYNVSDGQKPEQISKQPSDDEPLRLGAKEPKTDATPESADQSQQPIANISWLEAMEFCETMQRQLGLVTRLPTEIEWECAGRHQQDWLYPWDGNVFHAWAGKKEEDASPRILDAKKNRDITPNGIHDMSGNLSEWCLNEYRNSLFKEGNKNITYTPVPFSIQQRTVAIQPDLQATFRSYRGGSYRDDRFNCQLPARRALNASDRLPSIGFRIVLLPRFSK